MENLVRLKSQQVITKAKQFMLQSNKNDNHSQ